MSSETIVDGLKYVLQNVRLQSGDIWQNQVSIVTEAIEKITTLESVQNIMLCVSNLTKEKGVAMNSAQLVNLILEKLRRVEFIAIRESSETLVHFRWGFNDYAAIVGSTKRIHVYRLPRGMDDNNYNRWVEGVLNGKQRDADGNLS